MQLSIEILFHNNTNILFTLYKKKHPRSSVFCLQWEKGTIGIHSRVKSLHTAIMKGVYRVHLRSAAM